MSTIARSQQPAPKNTSSASEQQMRPWGIGRMRPYPNTAPVEYAGVEIDPDTQTGIYRDPHGIPVAMPKHGSNTGRETSQVSTHLDGTNDTDHDQANDQD